MAAGRRSFARRDQFLRFALSLALAGGIELSLSRIPGARADDAKPANTPAAQPLPKADLSSPLGKQVREKLDAIDREVARLKDAGGKAGVYGGQLADQARRVRDRLDGTGTLTPAEAATAELHLVGLYEGDFPEGPKKFGRAVVQLDVTERPVVLALCAYSPVRWDVRVEPGVKLRKIVVSGYGEQVIDPAPPEGVAVETRTMKGGNANAFYTYKAEGAEFTRAAEILRDWTHLEIATFQGQYRFGGSPIVVGLTDNEWRLRRAMSEVEPIYREATARERAVARQAVPAVRFPALLWGADPRFPMVTAQLADFTAVGPVEKTIRPLASRVTRITVDPRGPTYYAVDGHSGLQRIDATRNKIDKLEIKGDLPELSWPCGVAFDTKRNRVLLTSLGGVGYMYAYEPDKDQWSLLRDMANVDLESLTYSAAEDCFYGLVINHGERGRPTLQRFDAAGAPDRQIPLSAPLFVGESGMGMITPTQIVAIGDSTLVALAPPPDRRGGGGTMTASVVDLKTGKVIQSQPIRPAVEPRALAPEDLDRLWLALAGAATAGDAEAAINDLSSAGNAAVALIRAKLPGAGARPEAGKVRQWIAQLDAPDWKTREQATQELGAVAGQVRSELEAALAGNPGDEGRTRLRGLLKRLSAQLAEPATEEEPAEAVRDAAMRIRLRAIRVLGRIATPDAVDQLRDLAAEARTPSSPARRGRRCAGFERRGLRGTSPPAGGEEEADGGDEGGGR